MRANKLTLNIIPVLLLVLLLIGCTGQEADQPTPSASATATPVLPTAILTHALTETPQATATLTPTIGPTLTPTKVFNDNVEKGDYLIYLLEQDKKLFFYDPATDIHIPILPEWEINTFAVSMNDQIALSSTTGEQSDIYILDYPYWETSPINITNTKEISEYPHSWSPDGNYLLLHSAFEENRSIEVWDGTNFNQIHQFIKDTRFGYYEADWSPNGNFAFAVYSDGPGTEIYVWNGNPAETAVTVNQDPSHEGRYPKWSLAGDLAYLYSEKIDDEYVYSIKVWEDISSNDGMLTGSPFDIVAPELLFYYSFPNWTNTKSLVFFSMGIIYEWNREKVAPMNILGNYGYPGYWGPNENWVSLVPYPYGEWEEDRLFIHNESNETILETEGRYPPAWSPAGLLAFCVSAGAKFHISIWNGFEEVQIEMYAYNIDAMWRNGEAIYCSNG